MKAINDISMPTFHDLNGSGNKKVEKNEKSVYMTVAVIK